ncbi:MAG: hypothetical protein ACRBCI_01985 [Cellvibrionaceae bacterium]
MTFDEADKHLATIRSLIQHEDNLLNTRLGWMWTLQGLLFGAAGFMWGKDLLPIVVIASIGLLSSISIGYSCTRAVNAIGNLLEQSEDLKTKHTSFFFPPMIGASKKGKEWLLPWYFLPWVFSAAWVSLLAYHYFANSISS